MERMPSRGAAFLEGLTRPSPTGLVTMAVVTVLGIVGFLVFVTPDRLVSGLDRYFAGGGDEQSVAMTTRIIETSRRESDAPLLVVLGGSVARGAVIEEALEASIRQSLEAGWDVAELTTSRQSLWEAGGIVEWLPSETRGAVLLFLGPSRFARSSDEIAELYETPSLGIRSDFIDRSAEAAGMRPPPRTGNYVLDNRLFYQSRLTHTVRNLVKAAVGRELPRSWETQYEDSVLSEGSWDGVAERVYARFDEYDRKLASNIRVLTEVVEEIEARGMDAILVEAPISRRFVDEWLGDLYDLYLERVAAFASERGLAYLRIQELARIRPDEFHDWAHLRNASVGRRFTAVLGDTLPALLARGASGMSSATGAP